MNTDGLVLCEPQELYNWLQQELKFICVSDPCFMILLDAREKRDYNESHIVTAKKAPTDEHGAYILPYDADLECKTHVVIYDSNTASLDIDCPATRCARLMWNEGSRSSVKILNGGYETFSALYPFLRTQKIMFMPRELDNMKAYPIEVIPGFLYLGNRQQAEASYIQKDLKIRGFVNCSGCPYNGSSDVYEIAVPDLTDSDLLPAFPGAISFIDEKKSGNSVVIVYSEKGISRAVTIILAYLIHHYKIPLKGAYSRVLKFKPNSRPLRNFIQQLSAWEKEILPDSEFLTDISDPYY